MASFKTFLQDFGKDFVKVFSFLGSSQGQAVVQGVEGGVAAVAGVFAGPAGAAAVTGVEALINAALKQVISVEAVAAAAGQQDGSGPQKAAAVISAIAPQVAAVLTSAGISSPTATQVQTLATAVNTGIVAVLNAIPSATPAA